MFGIFTLYVLKCKEEFQIVLFHRKGFWLCRKFPSNYFGNITKAKLTTWIIEQHKQGIESPLITLDLLSYISNRKPLPIQDRIDNLLKYIHIKEQEWLAHGKGDRPTLPCGIAAAYETYKLLNRH